MTRLQLKLKHFKRGDQFFFLSVILILMNIYQSKSKAVEFNRSRTTP
jgi:hypothetical protein